jgi:hypothetical protein
MRKKIRDPQLQFQDRNAQKPSIRVPLPEVHGGRVGSTPLGYRSLRINRYVDFSVVEIQEGGAEVEHFRKEDDIPAHFERRGWTNNQVALRRWIDESEPGDMFAFQCGWIFHRMPK